MLDSATGMDFRPRNETEDRAIAEFYVEAVPNNFRTEKEGRPIFDDVEFVKILVPGDRRTEVVRRVTEEHRYRWPRQYEAFQRGIIPAEEGTPIEQWPPITPAMAKTLAFLNIRTVEALAAVSDTALAEIGLGARELRQKAIAWLGAIDPQGLANANAEIAELKAQMAQLIAAQQSAAPAPPEYHHYAGYEELNVAPMEPEPKAPKRAYRKKEPAHDSP